MNAEDFLHNAVIYLGAALVCVPIAARFGLGSVLGYLVAGILIGPQAFRWIASPEAVMQISEFGVVLLLFIIGLELNPRRLWQMRKPIFGMGGMQVALSIAFLMGAGLCFGYSWRASLVLGMGFAMSSTALVLQLLRERNLHQIPVGEAAFSVLLFQDIAVIPLLSLLPLLVIASIDAETAVAGSRWLAVGKAFGAVALVIVLGRYVVRPAFRFVVKSGVRELFTAFALALAFGVAYLMHEAGLSMALGTFLAGVLLADSEFRHELEVDIEPFKGLFLGLFFIAVGMSMELPLLKTMPLRVLGLAAFLVGAKALALFIVARLFRHVSSESRIFALALAQGGEFAFVLFGAAHGLTLLNAEDLGLFNLAVALSMGCTPFLFLLHEKWRNWCRGEDLPSLGEEHAVRSEKNPVILAGYGRIGQVIGRLLHAQGIGLTILEQDPGQIATVKKFGWQTYYGDVSRIDLLRAAGAEDANLLILAIDDTAAIIRTVELVRENFPHLQILARAESRLDAYTLMNLNVPTVRATFSPGLELGVEALRHLGFAAHESHVIGQRFRRYDEAQLKVGARHAKDLDQLMTLSAQAKVEIARIMENDERKRADFVGDGWG